MSKSLTTLLSRLTPGTTVAVTAPPAGVYPLANQLNTLLGDLQADPVIHPDLRTDLVECITEVINLSAQLGSANFDFDAVMSHYTRVQILQSRLLAHATKSRPRINGYGLTVNNRVLPFFAMSMDEAERMRAGMSSLSLDVVGVEVIHRSGFRPEAPAAPDTLPGPELPTPPPVVTVPGSPPLPGQPDPAAPQAPPPPEEPKAPSLAPAPPTGVPPVTGS